MYLRRYVRVLLHIILIFLCHHGQSGLWQVWYNVAMVLSGMSNMEQLMV